MPTAAYQECRYPRCPNYAVQGGYCATHATAGDRRSTQAGDLNNSNKRFRWMRAAYLRKYPMCSRCRTEPATILDHRIPHRGVALLFWSQHNWQGLCTHCHGVKTAHETLGHAWARYQ